MNIQSPTLPVAATGAIAAQMAALAHPARIEILRQLADRPACCCNDVVRRLDLAQSTVSQHLKVLVQAGLVRYSAERPRSRYELDREAVSALSASLAALLAPCLPLRHEEEE